MNDEENQTETRVVEERTEVAAPEYPSTSAQEVVDEVHEKAEQPTVVTQERTVTETTGESGDAA